jgi:hypothetical protein
MSNDRAFEDGQRLLKLKQTGTTREYARDFRTLASRLGWNDAALESHVYQGLSNEVKDIICKEERPNTLDELIQMAQGIDDRLSEREEEKRISSKQRAC